MPERETNHYCLAMYDVRGKQNYIFRSKHLREIIGASWIIRDVFTDYLSRAVNEYCSESGNDPDKGIFNQNAADIIDFQREAFEQRVAQGYLGEMIYDGGGNYFVLYCDKTTCIEINKRFTRKIIEETGTLKVLCSFIEGINFDDYKGDRNKLYIKHRELENISTSEIIPEVLPITQVDRTTGIPISGYIYTAGGRREATLESRAKNRKYEKTRRKPSSIEEGERRLDLLVENKGQESLLAIVYIDGNSMGAFFQNLLNDIETYEDCIRVLRKMSFVIQEQLVDGGINAINAALDKKYSGVDQYRNERRIVVFAGDEVNFIVNARDAMLCVETYFEHLREYNRNNNTSFSSCAGISIFYARTPYSEVYKMAEECCENGKRKMKEKGQEDAFYVDYQYNQGAIGYSLESIRAHEAGDVISRPWLYYGFERPTPEGVFDISTVNRTVTELNKLNRNDVKTLFRAAKEDITSFNLEKERIIAKSNEMNTPRFDEITDDIGQLRKLIYDIGLVYDLWYRKGSKQNAIGS